MKRNSLLGKDVLFMKYIHTNIVSKDWQKLSKFYQDVFQCRPILPQRDYSGEFIETVVGIPGVHVVGEHLALPGYGNADEPTLEIFTYSIPGKQEPLKVNDCGFAHICFLVEKGTIPVLLDKIVEHGGSILSTFPKGKMAEQFCVYTRDPNGNIIEIHY